MVDYALTSPGPSQRAEVGKLEHRGRTGRRQQDAHRDGYPGLVLAEQDIRHHRGSDVCADLGRVDVVHQDRLSGLHAGRRLLLGRRAARRC